MRPFAYHTAGTTREAVIAARSASFIAGGTDLLQLMQEGVATPADLVDINHLDLDGVASELDGIRIGALTRLSDLADDRLVRERFPVIAEALAETASGQVRNMATVGGNLLQRTRCLYFRDAAMPCNKREPGSGCPAMDGCNRINAILGGSDKCIAAHASDLAVALLACDGEVIAFGPDGERSIAIADLYRLPGDTPEIETVLRPDELITAIWLPHEAAGRHSHYLKVRDRAAFEWALVSCAASIETDGRNVVTARLAAGGVATRPWLLERSQAALVGRPLHRDSICAAAELSADGAEPRGGNNFKVAMLRAAVESCLSELAEQA